MTSPEAEPGASSDALRAVGRALAVLLAFHEGGHTLGVSRLSELTGLPKSTVHRLLTQLSMSGFLMRSGTAYRLSPLAFEMGSCYIHAAPTGLIPMAKPHLGATLIRTKGVVGLYAFDEGEVLLLDEVTATRLPDAATTVGQRVCRPGTAPAKAFAAFDPTVACGELSHEELQAIGNQGLAIDRGVLIPGFVTVSSPVLLAGERVLAAVTISAPVREADLSGLGAAALRTARLIAADFVDKRREIQDYGPRALFHDVLEGGHAWALPPETGRDSRGARAVDDDGAAR